MILEYGFFSVFCFFMIDLNRRSRSSFLCVSNYLIISYMIVTGIQVAVCNIMELEKSPIKYWAIMMIFLICTVLADQLGFQFANRVSIGKVKLKKEYPVDCLRGTSSKAIEISCIFASLFALSRFVFLAVKLPRFYMIVQEDFQSSYSDGMNFYIRLFLMICTVYFWGCTPLKKKSIFLGMMCFIPNMLTFVKGIVFIPCLGSILLRVKKKDIKISLKSGIFTCLVGILIFYLAYLIEMAIYDPTILKDSGTYKYIASKLIFYIISGVQSFSQNLIRSAGDFKAVDNVTLAPIINFFAKLGFGKSINTINSIFQTLGFSTILDRRVTSNVNGYIGTLYLFNGMFFGCLLNIFWTFVVSFMEECFIERNDILTAMSFLFCASFALGWFEYYFVHTFWTYLIVIAIFANLLLKLHFRRREKRVCL